MFPLRGRRVQRWILVEGGGLADQRDHSLDEGEQQRGVLLQHPQIVEDRLQNQLVELLVESHVLLQQELHGLSAIADHLRVALDLRLAATHPHVDALRDAQQRLVAQRGRHESFLESTTLTPSPNNPHLKDRCRHGKHIRGRQRRDPIANLVHVALIIGDVVVLLVLVFEIDATHARQAPILTCETRNQESSRC